MIQVQEDNLQVIREYASLLQTMDEAVHYIVDSFQDPEKMQGDRILGDIFSAFQQLLNSHIILENVLAEDANVQQAISRFDNVLEQSLQFNGKLQDEGFKQMFIRESFAPSFLKWSEEIQGLLKPYIAH
ncbi:hypothetical protein GCM10008967_06450 [Bacillus carboniphilus]|uniref:DUF8042 domain-containing protein n=1 Tax=Bacillus carboniphilus TaxID=86663 RepID=A0ABN0VVU2_9BACI